MNSLLNVNTAMTFFVFFLFFLFKKRVPSFHECSFNFLFIFAAALDVEWNASVWFDGFFSERWLWMSMMVCFCKEFACIVDEVDKICIFLWEMLEECK